MKRLTNNILDIVVIKGSIRPDNYTSKAVALVEDEASRHPDIHLDVIDPSELDLPLPGRGPSDSVKWLQKRVEKADGVILATPEYHGSYSSVMKLVIDNLGFPSVLKDKAVGLLGVAAGGIGAIKALEHLRSVVAHVGGMVLPQGVSIARVRDEFDENGHIENPQLEKMVKDLLNRLVSYIDARPADAREPAA